MPFARPTLSLKGRALRALAGREHSRVELQRKLQSFELAPGELAKVLDELAAKGFISEQRVAASLVHRRSGKLGTARLVQELKAKGVDPDAVAQVASELKSTELERAREVWRKKFGHQVVDDSADRATRAANIGKQMRFLASRGFAPEAIRRVMQGEDQD